MKVSAASRLFGLVPSLLLILTIGNNVSANEEEKAPKKITLDRIDELKELEELEHSKRLEILDLLTREPVATGPSVEKPLVVGAPKIAKATDDSVAEIIIPYEGFQYDEAKHLNQSYVIENKRFVEDLAIRCRKSTLPDDAMQFEPTFVITNIDREDVRLDGTVEPQAIVEAGFDPKKNTIIHVHGFTQSYPETLYLRRMRNTIGTNAAARKQNLIFIDYSSAVKSGYKKSCSRASVISSFLALFVMKLLELGADRKSIHLTGHSLGGPVIALAGKKIRPPIGRITTIDAAGPCFGKFSKNYNPNHTLSPNDAEQVVALHYDDYVLGLSGQRGHIDVFVNGGKWQPGCSSSFKHVVFQAVITTVCNLNRPYSPSHTRSGLVASANLGSSETCQHVAYECADYDTFQRGECGQCDRNNSQCFLLDFFYQFSDLSAIQATNSIDTSQQKKLYISTGKNEPYCSNHYQILVKLETNRLAPMSKLTLKLVDQQDQVISATLINKLGPNTFSYLLLSESAPTHFKEGRLRVRNKDGDATSLLAQALKSDSISVVEINFMSNIDYERRQALSSRLCAAPGSLSIDGHIKLVKC